MAQESMATARTARRSSTVRFFPDCLADLPVWGVDWHNPPFTRDFLLDSSWQVTRPRDVTAGPTRSGPCGLKTVGSWSAG